MALSSETVQRAAELASRGVSAARAGRFAEARLLLRRSLEYDQGNASVFLWLAATAASQREALTGE